MENPIYVTLTALISAFIGSYVGSYLKKKGEILATQDELEKLVTQVKAVTEATKKIEATLLDESWDRQRRWELKCDALLATVSALRNAHSAIQLLSSAYDVDMRLKGEQWNERIPEEQKRSSEALAVFNEKRFEASLVCSKLLNSALEKPASLMRVYVKNFARGDLEKAHNLVPRIGDAVNLAIDFMRKELGFTPLSGESAVTPTLGLLAPAKDKPENH